MENELENEDSLNLDENQDSNLETNSEESNEELTKAQEIAKNQRIRAEKAEAELKKLKSVESPKVEKETPKNENMSLKDIRALQDVPDEDVDEVIEYAKFKGITIADAKKNVVMQTLLRTKAEERKTAEATATSSTRKTTKSDGENLLKKADEQRLSPEEMREAAKAVIAGFGK